MSVSNCMYMCMVQSGYSLVKCININFMAVSFIVLPWALLWQTPAVLTPPVFGWISVSFIQSNSKSKGLLAKFIGRETKYHIPIKKAPAVLWNARPFTSSFIMIYCYTRTHVVWVMLYDVYHIPQACTKQC